MSCDFKASTYCLIVKKVVRRAELLKGHVKVSGVLLIAAADNPRPVHKLCHQTQHPKQDHHLESPRARPESLPALSFDSSQQVVQKQEEKQQRRYVVPRPRMLLHGGKLLLIFFLLQPTEAKGITVRCLCLGDFFPHDSGFRSAASLFSRGWISGSTPKMLPTFSSTCPPRIFLNGVTLLL